MNKENKPIVLRTADIYLRFPEIMEEECEDLFEFLDTEHIVYDGATDVFYDLNKENTNLKQEREELIKYLEDKIEELSKSQMTVQFINLENKVTSIPEIKVETYKEILDKVRGE